MPRRFWMSVLFLAVAVVALASPPGTQAEAPSSTVTENVQSLVFAHSTSTTTVIQVVCLTTATSELNATRTVISYTGVQIVFVVRATVTDTVPVSVTVTSSTTINRCFAFSETFIATRVVSVPFVLYSEVQRATQTSTWHVGACCVPSQTQSTPVIILVLASLVAALFLLLTARMKRRRKITRSWILRPFRSIFKA